MGNKSQMERYRLQTRRIESVLISRNREVKAQKAIQTNFVISSLVYYTRWLSDKESICNAGDAESIPGSGRSPGIGNGNPLHHSCLKIPVDRGAWQATIYVVARVEHDLATKQKPSKNPFILLNLHTIFLNLKIIYKQSTLVTSFWLIHRFQFYKNSVLTIFFPPVICPAFP